MTFVVIYDANVLYPKVHAAVQQIADSWRRPPARAEDIVRALERDGLIASAAALAD